MNETINLRPPSEMELVLLEFIKEKRRKRRWKLFFRFIYLIIIILLLGYLFFSHHFNKTLALAPHVALIKIEGAIDSDNNASAENIITSLNEAIDNPNVQSIILKINSPGGSPVQASEIYNEIMHIRQHKKIKIHAVCTDLCASAAYYIASAATDIYSDPSSLVGSIGVLINGFGVVDLMKKVGVERRLIVSGDNKGFLDPFSPLKPEDVAIAQNIINEVHQQFINNVKRGRGARLKDNPQLFTGMVWTGLDAQKLGLIDGFGSVNFVARDIDKNKNIVDYTEKESIFDQLSHGMTSSFAQQLSGLKKIGLD